ncbi:MAG: hypothetical protein JXP73_16970 [Deltaproteobacteria bacterium]|nr:hypothetical protein [Deltaproteobacteria bacterium]
MMPSERVLHGDWHSLEPCVALQRLDTSNDGLSAARAAQRLAEQGPNHLPERKRQSSFVRFLRQFHNVLIYVLLGAALVTALLQHWLDAGVILGVVVIKRLSQSKGVSSSENLSPG